MNVSVDDLLGALDAENEQIEAKYSERFEALGRAFFRSKDAPQAWSVQEHIGELEKMGARQSAIAKLRHDIERAVEKLTADHSGKG